MEINESKIIACEEAVRRESESMALDIKERLSRGVDAITKLKDEIRKLEKWKQKKQN